ncbi:MAG: SelL-related redox protein [Bacteroidota bacterium]
MYLNQTLWSSMITANGGEDLYSIAEKQPVLLVFLRYFGCSFCREAISDISRRRSQFESQGFRVVFVHMSETAETAEKFFRKYRLFPVDHIKDPEKNFYRAFGLGQTTNAQLLTFMNWMRGFQAAVIEGHGGTPLINNPDLGDGLQMPGVFVLHKGEIKRSYIHRNAYDRPDYEEICQL